MLVYGIDVVLLLLTANPVLFQPLLNDGSRLILFTRKGRGVDEVLKQLDCLLL
jgi:hypothetical protein